MSILFKPTLERVEWRDVREFFCKVNPDLAKIIDDLSPNRKLKLFRMRCHFGTKIVKQGRLYIPNEAGSIVPLTDSSIPASIQQSLGYNAGSNPVTVILSGQAELYIQSPFHDTPFVYGVIPQGKVFSTSLILTYHLAKHADQRLSHHPANFMWYLTAGTRNLFMLQKISLTKGYGDLQKIFNLKSPIPKKPIMHWYVFKEIANHPSFKNPWVLDQIYFGREWFEHLDDRAWVHFSNYLYKTGWEYTDFWRNQYIWDFVFSLIQQNRDLRPNPYLATTVKHLLTMCVGALPGFAPALSDNMAPIHGLQEVFTKDYPLEYEPTIIQPQILTTERPAYYLLNYPTTLEFSPRSRLESNKITDLIQIKNIIEPCLEELRNKNLHINGTPMCEVPETVSFDYFHSAGKNYNGIRSTEEIPIEDKSFCGENYNGFPTSSPLINGCIRLTKKG